MTQKSENICIIIQMFILVASGWVLSLQGIICDSKKTVQFKHPTWRKYDVVKIGIMQKRKLCFNENKDGIK